jgi:hypothetical protein
MASSTLTVAMLVWYSCDRWLPGKLAAFYWGDQALPSLGMSENGHTTNIYKNGYVI